MLNISTNKLNKKVDLGHYASGKRVFHSRDYIYLNRFLAAFAILGVFIVFLPWTQTIAGEGYLTTLKPDQRPQTIQSPIPGRIEQWFVKEGDFVEKGDTILHISEVKDEYFDPQLLSRTQDQIEAKNQSVTSYIGKVGALQNQLNALQNEQGLKTEQAGNILRQAKLKVMSDSMDLLAAQTNMEIADRQLNRIVKLQEEGLKAVRDVEQERMKFQKAKADMISQENKFLASKNEVINAQVELGRLRAEYAEKTAKIQSDLFTAQSMQYNASAEVTKLQNTYTNYDVRRGMNYIKSPQTGYINKALMAGVGETFKEGERLVNIMPAEYDMAVETFVSPIDLPLLHRGEKVRIQFDGWPAIVFSGWPNVSYGTYGGVVVAIETFISPNGKYRVLLAPDPEDHPWPKDLRVGSGASTLALLNDVPIWFELWRKLNGFPPDYYQPQTITEK